MWLDYSKKAYARTRKTVDNFLALLFSLAPQDIAKPGNSGQILIEVIIATVVIALVTAGVTQVVTQSLRATQRAGSQNTAVFLATETGEALRVIAKEDWHTITDLATSSVNIYHPIISNGKWATSTDAESVVLNNITYTRSFYVDEVFRAAGTGNIDSNGDYRDPSTAKIVSIVTWSDVSGTALSFSKDIYLSRFLNTTYAQTDWAGGSVGEQLISAGTATTTFATSSGIDNSSVTGSVRLSPQ